MSINKYNSEGYNDPTTYEALTNIDKQDTSIVKQLCSTDEVTAEKKYKDPFKYVPTHTLVLYTNHLPRVGANDDGIWRRLIVIPFTYLDCTP